MTHVTDVRRAALEAWVEQQLGATPTWTVASADASFRRYFRAEVHDGAAPASYIAMDAPPEREDNPAFVRIAELMAEAGLNVPRVLASDYERGFLLLSDLGTRTFLDVLDADNADALFGAASGALIDWQQASAPGVLPDYDRATLAAELELFRDWYLARHLRYTPTAAEQADIDRAFIFLLDEICAQPQVYVHRDYMPRNLMISHPLPGVLDFQDARYGPVTYDLASLFRDAFISWPANRIEGWVRHYWDAARERSIPVGDDFDVFKRDLALMGAQRHLKVLGIFARIAHRDGKPRYLADTPRFVRYLEPVVAEYEPLAGLAPLLARSAP
ncbi:aminoglycoside phosphotransferase protein [Salinisphaera shabanensis E1L3A]|uniref:Aminoglycoside phosphotransferase protein n=1 Tax=Salinisphaera shabanensis E1L3A TaxID=1033802 RepID=U2FUH7_9GAMM|nr:phosphotransferase [Salinisphaera shabanensis]ERJ18013.1 aminoglycoside phosphotransferase protein [Salinisphaera shabanensis E1L3A]